MARERTLLNAVTTNLTSAVVGWEGGAGLMILSGVMDTVEVYVDCSFDGTNWAPLDGSPLTDAKAISFTAAPCTLRARTVGVGASTEVTLQFDQIDQAGQGRL